MNHFITAVNTPAVGNAVHELRSARLRPNASVLGLWQGVHLDYELIAWPRVLDDAAVVLRRTRALAS